MKKTAFIVLISAFMFLSAHGADRVFDRVWDASVGFSQQMDVSWFAADSMQYTHRARYGSAPVALTNAGQVVVWEVMGKTGTAKQTNCYLIATGVVQSAAGVVKFTVSPAQANLTTGFYSGYVSSVRRTENSTNRLTLAFQNITVDWSPASTNYTIIAPLALPAWHVYSNAMQSASGTIQRVFNRASRIEDGSSNPQSLEGFQAESWRLNESITQNGSPFDLRGTNAVFVWEITGLTGTNVFMAKTGYAVNAAAGQLRFEIAPEDSNLLPGKYLGFVRSMQPGGSNKLSGGVVLAYQKITVNFSPDSRYYPIRGPFTQPVYYTTNLLTVVGPAGSNGLTGATGAAGTNGLSAYELAVSTGYVGTVSQWLSSLVGAPGSNGVAGVAGQNGTNGLSAYEIAVSTGFVGNVEAWLTSLRGANGSNGVAGSNGLTGATGPAGTNDAVQIAAMAQSITNLTGDIQTLADVENSYVVVNGKPLFFVDYSGGRPAYAASDSLTDGVLQYDPLTIYWELVGNATGHHTNSSASYVVPIYGWYNADNGVATNLNIQFFSGTDAQQQTQIDSKISGATITGGTVNTITTNAGILSITVKTNASVDLTGYVTTNGLTNLTARVTTLEAGCVTNLNQLLVQSELFTAESFDGAWYSSGANTWTNSTGWTAVNANIGTVGQVYLDATNEFLISPKTHSGYAYGVIDSYDNHGFGFSLETSTNGTNWVTASAGSQNVFVRYKIADSMPPSMGATYYTLLYSAAIYDFTVPEQFGKTNNFIGRDVRVDEPSTANNPVTLAKLQADLSALRAEVYGSFAALGDMKMQGNRMMWDTNFYTVGTSTNGSMQFGWNRQPVLEVFGGYTEFVVPILQLTSLSANSITIKTLGSTGWRPEPYYCTNLVQGVWTKIANTNYTTTYPTLTDGKYTLVLTNLFTGADFRVKATNETGLVTGGTNMVNSLYTFQSMGKIINPGVPTSTNGQPSYTFWVDTNDANRVKVKMP